MMSNITMTTNGFNGWSFFATPIKKEVKLERYIINNDATILFWDDKTKTISKRHKEDAFDKELGFLFAYYYKKCGLSNGARKRVIDTIDYSKIKTFLFEMYVKDSGKTHEEARKYLNTLNVEGVINTPSNKNFKVGDRVEITGKTKIVHSFKKGELGVIEAIDDDSFFIRISSLGQWVHKNDVKKVN